MLNYTLVLFEKATMSLVLWETIVQDSVYKTKVLGTDLLHIGSLSGSSKKSCKQNLQELDQICKS